MRNRFVLLADIVLIAVAAVGAFLGRFDWGFFQSRPEFVPFLVGALLIKPPVFFLVGMYRRYWRYTSLSDLAVVVVACTAASIVMGLYVAIIQGQFDAGFSRVVPANDWLLTLALTGGFRVALRVLNDSAKLRLSSEQFRRRVLIVGAGSAGTIVAREMRRNPQLGMEPGGFLDDAVDKIGKYVGGLLVFGRLDDLAEVVRAEKLGHVVIAMPTAKGATVRAVIDSCCAAGVSVQTVPGMFELLGGQMTISRLRTVEIADLLRRTPVAGRPLAPGIASQQVVMITGAGGSIGSELARQVALAKPAHLVLLGHGENSIFDVDGRLRESFPNLQISAVLADTRDSRRLAGIFDRFRPDLVFHAAAHKHVPLTEANAEEAVTNNVLATKNLIDQAVRVGTGRVVLISTDKAVEPSSIMGATKRLAEALVRQAARDHSRRFVVVRFGNVLGSRGSVVPTFKSQIERGGPITITHPDMSRFFMTIPEAVHLVLQAGGEGKGGELFVLEMGDPVKIVDLARDLVALSGFEPDEIPIEFTGVRPGEKLHESLFDSGAQLEATSHPDLWRVVDSDPLVDADLDSIVSRLRECVGQGDEKALRRVLLECVPGYTGPAQSAIHTR